MKGLLILLLRFCMGGTSRLFSAESELDLGSPIPESAGGKRTHVRTPG